MDSSTPAADTAPYLDRFAAVKDSLPGAGQEGLLRLRQAAMGHFSRIGLPGPKSELFKYTRIQPLLDAGYAERPEADGATPDAIPALEGESLRLVIVNGRLRLDLSGPLDDLPPGVTIDGLAQLMDDPGKARWLEERLGAVADLDDHPFLALNTAFAEDGVVIQLAKGAILERPVHIVYMGAAEAPQAVAVRNLILAGPGSEATVFEQVADTPGAEAGTFTNAVTEVSLGRDAALELDRLQAAGPDSAQFFQLRGRLEQGARIAQLVLAEAAHEGTYDGIYQGERL